MSFEENTAQEIQVAESLFKCEGFSDISKCFTKLHFQLSGQNKEIASIRKTVENLEHFANETHDRFREIHEQTLPNLESKLNETISNESIERTKLDLWSRKWNLIIRGVPGVVGEKPRETEKKVRNFLIATLHFGEPKANSMLFTAVHRLPSGRDSKNNDNSTLK